MLETQWLVAAAWLPGEPVCHFAGHQSPPAARSACCVASLTRGSYNDNNNCNLQLHRGEEIIAWTGLEAVPLLQVAG